jgi:hypothetical protein
MESRDYALTEKIDCNCDDQGSPFRQGDDLNHYVVRSCSL